MVDKKYLIIGGGVVVLVFLGIFVVLRLSNGSQRGGGAKTSISKQSATGEPDKSEQTDFELPAFTANVNRLQDNSNTNLTIPEKKNIVAFTGNAAGLLQTYASGDFSGITNLEKYSNASGINYLRTYQSTLQSRVPASGYSQYAVVEPNSILTYNTQTKVYSILFDTLIYNTIASKPKLIGKNAIRLDVQYLDPSIKLVGFEITPISQ